MDDRYVSWSVNISIGESKSTQPMIVFWHKYYCTFPTLLCWSSLSKPKASHSGVNIEVGHLNSIKNSMGPNPNGPISKLLELLDTQG